MAFLKNANGDSLGGMELKFVSNALVLLASDINSVFLCLA